MTKTLLIGSGNTHKAVELRDLLSGLPWDVKSLADFPPVEEPEETGGTFEANAILKARYYADHFNTTVVADDSGLAVDALDGAPGVYSARYAGPGCTYADNNHKLLEALAGRPWHERTAHFVCCAAFLEPGGDPHLETGVAEGHIAVEPAGAQGFGYDPLFVPSGHDKTFAEMTADQKHAISHRGRAFDQLKAWLEQRA